MIKATFRIESPWLAALLLAGLALVASSPLFADGWYLSHESMAPLQRVIALSEEIRHGDFYPRWLSVTYGGKGSAFFNFYSPGFYLVSAYFHVAGVPLVTSVKLPAFMLFFGGACGMYLWTKRNFGALGGIVAAIIYLFVPYHFVDIYVRGAFAEFAALAVLPYLFWGIDLSLTSAGRLRGVMLVAASSTLLLLSHHLSTIMILPFALLYTLARLLQLGFTLQRLLSVATGPLVGAGLSAFYWLPMLAERKFLGDFFYAVTAGYGFYALHFVFPRQWFSQYWDFGPSLQGPNDQMSFQIGTLLVICSLLTLLSLTILSRKERSFTLLTLTLGVMALLLTASYSARIYQLIPAFAYIQFPWRFLGPATLFLAAACGAIGALDKVRRFGVPLLVALAALAIVLSAGQRITQQHVVEDFDQLEPAAISGQAIGSMCSADEYLPCWTTLDTAEIRTDSSPHASSGAISQLVVQSKKMRFTVSSNTSQTTVIIPWFYFPGWQATIDRQPVPVSPSAEGFLSLNIPQGLHEVSIHFGTTTPRVAGWLIAGTTLAGFCGICGYLRRKRHLAGAPSIHGGQA